MTRMGRDMINYLKGLKHISLNFLEFCTRNSAIYGYTDKIDLH